MGRSAIVVSVLFVAAFAADVGQAASPVVQQPQARPVEQAVDRGAIAPAEFDRMDLNRDGVVSRSEYVIYASLKVGIVGPASLRFDDLGINQLPYFPYTYNFAPRGFYPY